MENKNPSNKPAIIREIKDNAPFSNYQIYSYITTVLSLLVMGLEFNLYSNFNIPLKSKLTLSNLESQLFQSLIYLGFSFGSITGGTMSTERTTILKYAPIFVLFFHILMYFLLTEIPMIIFRILIGLSLGSYVPIAITIFAEYRNTYFRGFNLIFIWFFYILSSFIESLLCFIIMPNYEEKRLGVLILLLIIFIFPSVIFHFNYSYDSPRHLIFLGENHEGFEIIKSINKRTTISEDEKHQITNDIFNNIANKNVENKLRYLLSQNNERTTIILIYLLFTISFSFIGLQNLIPLTKQIIYGQLPDTNKKIVISQLMINCICCIGIIPFSFIAEINKLGRKGLMIICFIGTCLFSCFSIFNNLLYNVMIGCCLSFSLTSFAVTFAFIIEFYCMRLRDLALGFLIMLFMFFCILSNVIFYFLHNKNYKIPYYVISICSLIAAFLSYILPFDTGNNPLDLLYMIHYQQFSESKSNSNSTEEENEDESNPISGSKDDNDI